MGWICDRCGQENAFSSRICSACLKKAPVYTLIVQRMRIKRGGMDQPLYLCRCRVEKKANRLEKVVKISVGLTAVLLLLTAIALICIGVPDGFFEDIGKRVEEESREMFVVIKNAGKPKPNLFFRWIH